MNEITDSKTKSNYSCSSSNERSSDAYTNLKLGTHIKHINDTALVCHSTTNESTNNNMLSFESNCSKAKISKFLRDIHQGYNGRPACPSRSAINKSKFDEDMKKIGIDTNSLINENFRLSVNFGNKEKKRKSISRFQDFYAKSRQNRFRMNDELATIDMGIKGKEKHWRELDESPSRSAKDDMNPLLSFFVKKKPLTRKQTTSDQLKKAIFSMKIAKTEASNLDRKKKKAYMNILNLIYNNHIKKK